jgi:hypothetical protein
MYSDEEINPLYFIVPGLFIGGMLLS